MAARVGAGAVSAPTRAASPARSGAARAAWPSTVAISDHGARWWPGIVARPRGAGAVRRGHASSTRGPRPLSPTRRRSSLRATPGSRSAAFCQPTLIRAFLAPNGPGRGDWGSPGAPRGATMAPGAAVIAVSPSVAAPAPAAPAARRRTTGGAVAKGPVRPAVSGSRRRIRSPAGVAGTAAGPTRGAVTSTRVARTTHLLAGGPARPTR